MDMASKKQYLKRLQEQYCKASKKIKTGILDEFTKNTGHHRKYVIQRLNSPDLLSPKKRKRREAKNYYDDAVIGILKFLYKLFDYPCGQRLKPLIGSELERLRKFGEIKISDHIAQKLKKISTATIDRKLKDYKAKAGVGNRFSTTKAGSLLKRMIPIRLTEWDTSETGYLEADTVAHCGGNASGVFISSLSLVEISSGWWEGEGLMNKGQKETLAGLKNMRERTPFIWKGIDSDNGGEFINHPMYKYCQKENIYFTRSRPNKKNDNAYVEQKNWTHVRKILGYGRYDTQEECDLINDLYRNELRLFKNFFQPVLKLKSKTRVGSIKHRWYETAKTPYQRILESNQVSDTIKKKLMAVYWSLNPAQVKRDLDKKLDVIYQIQQQKERRKID
jgi:hypothetical protein